MIQEAKMITRTEDLAKKLQAEQMQHWLTIPKDPNEVFHLFKLDDAVKSMFGHYNQRTFGEAGRSLFGNPKSATWAQYVDDLSAKHVDEAVSMIPTLRKYISDEALLKTVETAKKVEGTKSLATKLEDAFVQFWAKSKNTPDDVLVKLGLGNSVDTLLENSLLSTWTKYVDAYNVKYPDTKMTMIETLTQTFNDERMAKMLVVAKTKGATKKMATALESAQLNMWLSSGKSVDDVFELLKLYQKSSDFSHTPLLNTWVAYMNTFIEENPSKTSTFFLALETRFSDRLLIQILKETKKFPSMESAATKMQIEKTQNILASKQSPEKVFKLIGLDDMGDDILSTPLFQKWMNYVEIFNKENPTKKESWFLPIHIAYESFGVEQMIDKAMQIPSTVKIAERVESAMIQEWLERWKYPPTDAFRFLHLKEAGDNFFLSPKFKTWAKYLTTNTPTRIHP